MLEVRRFSWNDARFGEILARGADMDREAGRGADAIVDDVRARGDEALLEYVNRFDSDKVTPDSLRVSDEEFAEAKLRVSEGFLTAVALARVNIRKFHEYQRRGGYVHDDGDGVRLAKRVIPLARVGVYCPAGTAPLFSSLLMNVIPAQIAGVREIYAAIPPLRDGTVEPHMLVAASLLSVDAVYRMGGAQAIAAFAYGTARVPRVDKIVGPGNAYVAAAKRRVFGAVGIDSVAGPSEIAVVADHTAPAKFVAADLLSQVEHGSGFEAGVVFTTDRDLAEAVRIEAGRMLAHLERSDAVRGALSRYGAIFVCSSLYEAVDAVNVMAPEHLELMTADNEELLTHVDNAGAVFLGPWSPEPVGDYFAGSNHVLPTAGASRFSSGLSVHDFVKDMTVVEYSAERLRKTGRHVVAMAETEGLTAHANAVEVRLRELGKAGTPGGAGA